MTTPENIPSVTCARKAPAVRRTLLSAAVSLMLGAAASTTAMATSVSPDDGVSPGNDLRARIQGWRAERLTDIRNELIGMHQTLRDEIREWGDMIRDDAEAMRAAARDGDADMDMDDDTGGSDGSAGGGSDSRSGHEDRLGKRQMIVDGVRGRLDHLERARFDRGLDASAVVPVPAAVWLFGSGLLGLIGVSLRRKAAT